MFSSSVVQELVLRMKSLEQARAQLHRFATDLLSTSKRSMFAFHRGDDRTGVSELQLARTIFDDARQIIQRESRLIADGPWRSAQEEYAEAVLFAEFIQSGTLSTPPIDDPELILGALSDVAGELARKAILLATEGKRSSIEAMFVAAQDIMALLLSLDLTGNLRAKVDQARQHLRKIEEIRYDLEIHQR